MKTWFANLLSLGLGCILALALFEIFLRYCNPLPFRVKHNDIVLPANRTFTFQNNHIPALEKTIVCSKNSLGFRGEEIPADFSEWRSILVVGGSTTECRLLSDGKDWASLLLQGLRRKFPAEKIWLNNAGVDGHSTFGHLVLMKNYGCELKPRQALFLVGINEIGRNDLFPEDLATRRSLSFSVGDWLKKNSEIVLLGINLYRMMLAHRVDLAHGVLDLPSLPNVEPSANSVDSLMRAHEPYRSAFKNRLLELMLETKRCGIQPTLITQPLLFGEGTDDVSGVSLASVQTQFFNGKTYWLLLESYNDVTRSVAAETGIPLIDLACEMPKSSAFFYDAMHFTEAGARRVSQILVAHFCFD